MTDVNPTISIIILSMNALKTSNIEMISLAKKKQDLIFAVHLKLTTL